MNRRAFLLGSAVLGLVGPKRLAEVVTSTVAEPVAVTGAHQTYALGYAVTRVDLEDNLYSVVSKGVHPRDLWPGVKAWYEKNYDPSQWDGIFGDE